MLYNDTTDSVHWYHWFYTLTPLILHTETTYSTLTPLILYADTTYSTLTPQILYADTTYSTLTPIILITTVPTDTLFCNQKHKEPPHWWHHLDQNKLWGKDTCSPTQTCQLLKNLKYFYKLQYVFFFTYYMLCLIVLVITLLLVQLFLCFSFPMPIGQLTEISFLLQALSLTCMHTHKHIIINKKYEESIIHCRLF